MKKIRLALTGLLTIGVLASCSSKSKDAPTPPTPPAPQPPVSTEYIQTKHEIFHDAGNVPRQGTVFTYNAQGQVTKRLDQAYDDTQRKLVDGSYTTFTYEGNLLKEEKSYFHGGTPHYRLTGSTKYIYQGTQLVKKEEFGVDGNTGQFTLNGYEEYTYAGGRKSEVKRYTVSQGTATLSQIKRYTYQDGKEIESNYASESSQELSRNEYRYDDKGRTIELTHIEFIAEFDGNGQPTGRMKEASRQTILTEYNQLGNIAKEKTTFKFNNNVSESVATYAYSEPDEKGNPKKLVASRSFTGQPAEIFLRKTFAYTYAKR